MPENEVFPYPTVKRVVFQIRFPNLFYLESRMGDLQLRVLERFPKSALIIRRQFIFADVGPSWSPEDLSKSSESGKVWQFKSEDDKISLEVASNRLTLESTLHKTYNSGTDPKVRFRDCIEFSLGAFFALVPVPRVSRIGLRYIDECPVPSLDEAPFREWYNTTFPLARFGLATATEMVFRTAVRIGTHGLKFEESLRPGDPPMLLLDFDGFALDTDCNECLEVSDQLHDLITKEYRESIKEPVYDYMRKGPEKDGEKA